MQPNDATVNNTGSNRSATKKVPVVVVAAVFLVVIGVILAVSNHHNSSPTSVSSATPAVSDKDYDGYAYESTVTVDDQGFSPASLKVKPDTRVYWKNADGNTTTHQIVPTEDKTQEPVFGDESSDFDANGGYAYSFRHEGTYHYHDKYNPALNGEIIVAK